MLTKFNRKAVFLSNRKVQFWISDIWQVFSFRFTVKWKKICQIIMESPLNNNVSKEWSVYKRWAMWHLFWGLALNSGIQTNQILTNDDEVCITSLSNILLALVYQSRELFSLTNHRTIFNTQFSDWSTSHKLIKCV